MTASVLRDRRSGGSRRKQLSPMKFPFFDRYGQIVLWDRRQRDGRRKADEGTGWSKKDLPGFILMAVMLIVLSLGLMYFWKSKPSLSTQGAVEGPSNYAQSLVSRPDIGQRALRSLPRTLSW